MTKDVGRGARVSAAMMVAFEQQLLRRQKCRDGGQKLSSWLLATCSLISRRYQQVQSPHAQSDNIAADRKKVVYSICVRHLQSTDFRQKRRVQNTVETNKSRHHRDKSKQSSAVKDIIAHNMSENISSHHVSCSAVRKPQYCSSKEDTSCRCSTIFKTGDKIRARRKNDAYFARVLLTHAYVL